MLLILLAACDFKNGDDVEMPYCADTPTDVAMDEVTPLGFAAADVVPFASGEHPMVFLWADDGVVDGTVTVALDGTSPRFVDSEPVYPEGDGATPAIGVECDDRVEVDAAVSLVTVDGSFDELWTVALQAVDATAMTFFAEVPDADFAGTYVLEDHLDVGDYTDLSAYTQGSFTATGAEGVLDGQVSGEDECAEGDDCSAWAQQVPIGDWATSVED